MSCLHEFSLRMHTLVCKHASPASKLCSQDMRIACSARMCGRPAATPYSGLRPSAAVPYPGVRPSKAGLRPYLIPVLRPCERGLRFYLVNFYQRKKLVSSQRFIILKWVQGCRGVKSVSDRKNSRSPIHYVPKDLY